MKVFIFIFFFFLSTSVVANSLPESFEKSWELSKLEEYTSEGQVVYVKQMRRVANFKYFKSPIAHVSLTYTNNSYEKQDQLYQNLHRVQSLFDQSEWTTKKIDLGWKSEALWVEGNRKFRFYTFKESQASISIFISFRPGYTQLLEQELNSIVKQVKKDLSNHPSIKRTSYFPSIIPKAYAYDSSLLDHQKFLDDGVPDSLSSDSISGDVNSDINIDGNVAADVDVKGDFQVGVDARTTQAIEEASADFNYEFGRFNDSFEKVVDPGHMFKVAAATSAGAALGSVMANLLIDGIAGGAHYIWDKIWDTSGKKIRWENFQEARKNWESINSNILALEKEMDNFLNSYSMLNKMKGIDIIEYLWQARRDAEFNKMMAKDQYTITSLSIECRRHYFDIYKDLDSFINNAEQIKKYFSDKGIHSLTIDDGFFCNRLEALRRRLLESENMLADMRLHILSGREEWFSHEQERLEELQKASERINDINRIDNLYEQDQELLEEIENMAQDDIAAPPPKWLNDCQEGDNQVGRYIRRRLRTEAFHNSGEGGMARVTKSDRVNRCKKAYSALQQASSTDAQSRLNNAIQLSHQKSQHAKSASTQKPIGINYEKRLQEIDLMREWFGRLEAETFCYNNRKNSQYQHKCDQLFPNLQALDTVHDKSQQAWEEQCTGAYSSLSSNLEINDDEAVDKLKSLNF